MQLAIFDITANYPGTDEFVPNLYHSFLNRYATSASDIVVIARTDQRNFKDQFPGIKDFVLVEDKYHTIAKVAAIFNDLAVGEPATIIIGSYHSAILGLAHGSWKNLDAIESVSFSQLSPETTSNNSSEQVGWKYGHVAPQEHAMSVFLSALGDVAIKQQMIKPRMASIDPVFSGKAHLTNTQGMISTLRDLAEKRGLVEVDRRPAQFIGDIHSRPNAPIIRRLGPTTPRPIQESLKVPETLGTNDQVKKHRSRVLGECLSAKNCGPYSDARPHMYTAIDTLMADETTRTLRKVVSESCGLAKSAMQNSGDYSAKTIDNQPWDRVSSFMINLITFTESAIEVSDSDKDDVISPGFTAGGKSVSQLKEGWSTRCDAFLIYSIIELIDDVTAEDRTQLARALYHSSSEDAQIHVDKAVAYLIRSGQAEEYNTEVNAIGIRPAGPQSGGLRMAE